MAAEIEDLCRKRIIRSTAEALGSYLQERRLTEKKIWQGWTKAEMNGKRLTDKEIDDNVKAIIRKLDK